MKFQELLSVTIERYKFDDYILEVYETEDAKSGKMFEFWLYKERYGVKMLMFGTPINQPCMNPPRIFTKEECLDMAFCAVPDYIECYKNEYEDGEED